MITLKLLSKKPLNQFTPEEFKRHIHSLKQMDLLLKKTAKIKTTKKDLTKPQTKE